QTGSSRDVAGLKIETNRVLPGVYVRYVWMIQDVESFPNELNPDSLSYRNSPGDSRIERNPGWQIEGIPAHAGCAVGRRIAIVVEVGVEEPGIGMAGLCREYSAEFPSTQ